MYTFSSARPTLRYSVSVLDYLANLRPGKKLQDKPPPTDMRREGAVCLCARVRVRCEKTCLDVHRPTLAERFPCQPALFSFSKRTASPSRAYMCVTCTISPVGRQPMSLLPTRHSAACSGDISIPFRSFGPVFIHAPYKVLYLPPRPALCRAALLNTCFGLSFSRPRASGCLLWEISILKMSEDLSVYIGAG